MTNARPDDRHLERIAGALEDLADRTGDIDLDPLITRLDIHAEAVATYLELLPERLAMLLGQVVEAVERGRPLVAAPGTWALVIRHDVDAESLPESLPNLDLPPRPDLVFPLDLRPVMAWDGPAERMRPMVVDRGELVARIDGAFAVLALPELSPAAAAVELERWGADFLAKSLAYLERKGAVYVTPADARLSVKREPANPADWPRDWLEAFYGAVRDCAVDVLVEGGGGWEVPDDSDDIDTSIALTSAVAEMVAAVRSGRLDGLRWTASARAFLKLRPAA
jgi:hypothetical protein